MEYKATLTEQRITIDGIKYDFDIDISGWLKYGDDYNDLTEYVGVSCIVYNVFKKGDDTLIEDLKLEQEIEFQLQSELEHLLEINGEPV